MKSMSVNNQRDRPKSTHHMSDSVCRSAVLRQATRLVDWGNPCKVRNKLGGERRWDGGITARNSCN